MSFLLPPRTGVALPRASPRRARSRPPPRLAFSSAPRAGLRGDGPARGRERGWLAGLLAAVVVLSASSSIPAGAASSVRGGKVSEEEQQQMQDNDGTLADVPQTLSGGDGDERKRIQKPKSRQAESCTVKCLGTCIRGGAGSPGEGPFNIRKPIVVFKSGFRSRNYCLVECSDICNLIKDGEDGP
ncbi:uncharacterized protein LOC144709905 [Wolffia australiana]